MQFLGFLSVKVQARPKPSIGICAQLIHSKSAFPAKQYNKMFHLTMSFKQPQFSSTLERHLTALRTGISVEFSQTQEVDSILLENIDLSRVVPSMLDFSNMASTKEKLAGTALRHCLVNRNEMSHKRESGSTYHSDKHIATQKTNIKISLTCPIPPPIV